MINKNELLEFLLQLRETINIMPKNTNEYLVKGSLLTLDAVEQYINMKSKGDVE